MIQRIVSTLLMIVFAVSSNFGQTPEPPRPPNDMHQRIFKKLNLTEAQETQMKKLRIELMKKQTQLHSKIQTLRLDNKGQFLADKVDRNAIEKNIKAITGLQEQLKLNMVDQWFAVNSILTPDQQKVWKNAAMEMGDKMRDGMKQRVRKMIRERVEEEPDFD